MGTPPIFAWSQLVAESSVHPQLNSRISRTIPETPDPNRTHPGNSRAKHSQYSTSTSASTHVRLAADRADEAFIAAFGFPIIPEEPYSARAKGAVAHHDIKL